MIDTATLKLDIIKVLNKTNAEKIITENDVNIRLQKAPHEATKLPDGKVAVYGFIYEGQFLMVAYVGENSNPRFQHQQYYPSHNGLANELLEDRDFNAKFNVNNVSDWIKRETDRIDILIDKRVSKNSLRSVKAFLIDEYQPRYTKRQ